MKHGTFMKYGGEGVTQLKGLFSSIPSVARNASLGLKYHVGLLHSGR